MLLRLGLLIVLVIRSFTYCPALWGCCLFGYTCCCGGFAAYVYFVSSDVWLVSVGFDLLLYLLFVLALYFLFVYSVFALDCFCGFCLVLLLWSFDCVGVCFVISWVACFVVVAGFLCLVTNFGFVGLGFWLLFCVCELGVLAVAAFGVCVYFTFGCADWCFSGVLTCLLLVCWDSGLWW